MSLKFRYALFLLTVFLLIIAFCVGSVVLLSRGSYLLTLLLLGTLYGTTFILGKKFSHIFFTLSFLRMLRTSNGVVSMQRYEQFISTSLARRKNHAAANRLKKNVLQQLEREGIISISQEGDIILINI